MSLQYNNNTNSKLVRDFSKYMAKVLLNQIEQSVRYKFMHSVFILEIFVTFKTDVTLLIRAIVVPHRKCESHRLGYSSPRTSISQAQCF